MLFRMVPKLLKTCMVFLLSFRVMLFRMVPKPACRKRAALVVLESCCLEWYQNFHAAPFKRLDVLESCCLEWYQNPNSNRVPTYRVLESCCLEWYQNKLELERGEF